MFTKSAIAVAAVAGLVSAAPQAVTSAIAPKETTPAGCSQNYDGTFEIQVVNVTQSKTKRDDSEPLVSTLKNGVLTDSKGRTGYIASNNQFQYDGPPQAGAIYTAGFSVCQNGSLALGNSVIFYQCLSGTFYNLYDENAAAQCSPVYIEVINQGASTTADAHQIADGQVTASPVPDVACQIGDGQLQQNTCTGQAVTQINDGQIQAPTGAPVTQINDGQIQAPTSTAAAVSAVTQINDGQIQAPTGAPVTQINDGQIQAPTNASVASPTVVPFTGSASSITISISALVAGVVAVLAL